MDITGKLVLAFLIGLGSFYTGSTQCETWNDSPKKETAENAHVTYRGYVKNKSVEELAAMSDQNWNIAFDNWKTAYEIAPNADGQRPFHFTDGRKFYKALAQRTADAAKKAEYNQMAIALYDQQLQCYPKDSAYLLGRKGFDQFYLQGYTMDALKSIERSMAIGGNKSEYILFVPLGELLTYFFQQKNVNKDLVQNLYEAATNIASYNAENNKQYGEYYKSGMANMDAKIAEIESEVFDCDYFKTKLTPLFEENRDSFTMVKYIYNKLVDQGCVESDPVVTRVKQQYDELYAAIAAAEEAEKRANNPAYDANQLREEGKYREAIARYREAIEMSEETERTANFVYAIAQIQAYDLNSVSQAISTAREAASIRSGWGKPYILIGDMYGRLSRGCSDAWEQRLGVLAAIEKYQYAKSIDSEVADEANKRIGNYSGSLPTTEDAFQRGYEAGQKVRSSCIGETVTIRLQ